jgi:hypothetical protein
MDLQAISGAATIAVACAIVFLIAAKSWGFIIRAFSAHPSFADSIMFEAAERFRDRLAHLTREQATYLGSAVVFVVMYVAATLLDGSGLFIGYPDWQLYILLAALVAAAAFVTYRLGRTILEWRRICFVRDANVAVGHQLQRIAAGHGRAYHDVRTPAGVIDHVMVGSSGVYAVNVIARRHLRQGSAMLKGNQVVFSHGGDPEPIVDINARCKQLQKQFRSETGSDIRVRSVIAVPGWDIARQNDEDHLLVNERTLPMITGWRSRSDHLLNEDVSSLQDYLTGLCRRR